MRIHTLQHVSFEGPGIIADYAHSHSHALTTTLLYEWESPPDLNGIDLLVVKGGPMNIYEEEKYPWLPGEKKFIRDAIHAGKAVLGICLGAQLIADVLGARVFPGDFKEIGWFPITLTEEGRQADVFRYFPDKCSVFHWHGDTFSIPEGAMHLAQSAGCLNQAFIYTDRVLGLQFHLESTEVSIRELVRNCQNEIVDGKYIQSEEEMSSPSISNFGQINDAMFGILDYLIQACKVGKSA
jgi:GMP synthase-like glutamine amidotransferase